MSFGVALALTLLALVRPGAQELEPTPSESALLRAERLASEGHYAKARSAYERIVRRHPGSPAAEVAARRSRPSAFLGWRDLVRSGPSSNRVDIVLMGEGYQLGEQDQFDDLADDLVRAFERQPTLREYFAYFNFTRANLVSADNGVDGFGRDYDTALGGRTLATYSGHIGIDRKLVYAMLDELPEHDRLAIVFAKLGVAGTASGGVATIGGRNMGTAVHEWGHAFGRLSDEYAHKNRERGKPRDGINVSDSEGPTEVPWAHWIEAKVPGIGTYEGALGQVRDAWRPTASGCVMNDGGFFCRVCREAMVLAVYRLVDPIDACNPPAPRTRAGLLLRDEPLDLEVRVLQPAEHELEVLWWIEPAALTPSTPAGDVDPSLTERPRRFGDRRDRGPLTSRTTRPEASTRPDRTGTHTYRLRPSDFEPGRYRITCRASDTTKHRSERYPWVLQDPYGLLESERAWWLQVLAR